MERGRPLSYVKTHTPQISHGTKLFGQEIVKDRSLTINYLMAYQNKQSRIQTNQNFTNANKTEKILKFLLFLKRKGFVFFLGKKEKMLVSAEFKGTFGGGWKSREQLPSLTKFVVIAYWSTGQNKKGDETYDVFVIWDPTQKLFGECFDGQGRPKNREDALVSIDRVLPTFEKWYPFKSLSAACSLLHCKTSNGNKLLKMTYKHPSLPATKKEVLLDDMKTLFKKEELKNLDEITSYLMPNLKKWLDHPEYSGLKDKHFNEKSNKRVALDFFGKDSAREANIGLGDYPKKMKEAKKGTETQPKEKKVTGKKRGRTAKST